MALNKTDYQFMLVEAADASQVPFVAGQYIIQDDGKAFYDPSIADSVDSRIELSPDLSAVLSKNFANKLLTGISATQVSGTNEYMFTVSSINPDSNQTSTETFSITIDVAENVAEGDFRPVSGGAVKTYVDTEIAAVQELARESSCEVYVVEGAAADVWDAAFDAKYPEAQPKKGDLYIFSQLIEDTDPEARTHATYVYDGVQWVAADGSYTADNVYFTNDLTITAAIGIHTIPSSGSKTLSTKGKSVKQVFDMIVAQEKAPKVTSNVAVTTKIGNGESSTPGTTAISVNT